MRSCIGSENLPLEGLKRIGNFRPNVNKKAWYQMKALKATKKSWKELANIGTYNNDVLHTTHS